MQGRSGGVAARLLRSDERNFKAMRLPCGHYGDEWDPDQTRGGPAACADPECVGDAPDPWLIAQEEDRQHRLAETRHYRQCKWRRKP